MSKMKETKKRKTIQSNTKYYKSKRRRKKEQNEEYKSKDSKREHDKAKE